MNLRMHRSPTPLVIVGIVCLIGTVVGGLVLVFSDPFSESRTHLSALVAVGLVLSSMISYPEFRPAPEPAVQRRRRTLRFGTALVLVSWPLRLALLGAAGWIVASNSGSSSFNALGAVMVAVSMTLATLMALSQSLLGYGRRVGTRVWTRRALAIAVAAAMAGFAGALAAAARFLNGLSIGMVWGVVHGKWGMPGFLAVIVTAIAVIVAVAVIGTACGLLTGLAAMSLGPGNAVGRWLEKHSPVKWSPKRVWMEFNLFLNMSQDDSRLGRDVMWYLTWPFARFRDRRRRRDARRVLNAVVDLIPPDSVKAAVRYRAVGGHEEVELSTRADAAEERSMPLAEFRAIRTLRWLRTDFYHLWGGRPLLLVCSASVSPPDRRRRPEVVRKRDLHKHAVLANFIEPAWISEPARDDFLRELKQYPAHVAWESKAGIGDSGFFGI
jgi:hypothetical protein